VFTAGAVTCPMPIPVTSSGPRMAEAYPEWTPILVSQTMPPAAISRPSPTSGLGPVRGISTICPTLTDATTAAGKGRNARPVSSGEYPRVVCTHSMANTGHQLQNVTADSAA
jgi:hypothetical protein